MNCKRFLTVCFISHVFALAMYAQDQVLDDLATIKPMVSTKQDVLKKFTQAETEGNSLWLYLPDKSIEFFFSNGECREDWLAPIYKVVTISVFFRGGRQITDLTTWVKLKRLRTTYSFHGDRLYHDDKKGIMYYVDAQGELWSSMTYYPSKKFSHLKC